MICILSCVIAIILFIANVYVMLSTNNSRATYDFYKTLTPALLKRYKSIVAERSEIYMRGTGIGLIVGIGAAAMLRDKKGINRKCRLCIVAAITLVVNCLFYLMYPKSDYIITHLTTQDQRKAWVRCYKGYQISYITGLILGASTSYLLANNFCV